MADTFRLTIDTANAAFENDKHSELARILREIADKLEHGYNGGIARDINGNAVGTFACSARRF